MSSLAIIDLCILRKIPVYVVGWENLGVVIVTKYTLDLNMDAFVLHFRKSGKDLMEYTVLITTDHLPKAIYPATKAGIILFGKN